MNKTLLAKTLVDLGAKVADAFQQTQAPKLMRKIAGAIHLKQVTKSEDAIVMALIPFFEEQVKSVQRELKKLGTKDTPINTLYNPEDWNLELLQRIAPPLAQTMAEGISAQMTLMNADPGRYTKSWQKNFEDPEFKLETPYGDLDIQFLTKYPQWMRDKIKEMLDDTFSQPYWPEVNKTTKGDIDKFLQEGIQEGWSLETIANEIKPLLLQEGEYAKRRALLIARTESTHALNGAKSAAIDTIMEDPRIIMKKVWFSALKDTTRASHAPLDGVPADKDGRWLLSGIRCRWPGDTNLPPEERCNCYCTLVSEFGLTDAQSEQLLQDYYGRSERSFFPVIWKGGPGSGNWAHVGRPGHVGGSGGGGGHHKLPPGHQYHKPSGGGGGSTTRPEYDEQSQSKWISSLSEKEKEAFNHYAATMDNYNAIRAHYNGEEVDEKTRQIAKTLEQSSSKAPRFVGEVYRGIKFNSKEEYDTFQSKLEENSGLIESKTFTSSTKSSQIMNDFALPEVRGTSVSVKITVKSKNGVDVSSLEGINKNQKEVIFPPGTKFQSKIVKVTEKPDDRLGVAKFVIDMVWEEL